MKSVNMPFKCHKDLEVSAFFQAEFIVGAQNSKQYGWHLDDVGKLASTIRWLTNTTKTKHKNKQ